MKQSNYFKTICWLCLECILVKLFRKSIASPQGPKYMPCAPIKKILRKDLCDLQGNMESNFAVFGGIIAPAATEEK